MDKFVLEKHLELAEYWANKKGYEQEAIQELISVVTNLVRETKVSTTVEVYEGRDIGDLK